MSINMMSKVWKLEDLEPNQKLVLLALCDNANDEGLCYPSIDTIQSKTSLSRATVIRIIKVLVEAKYIIKTERARKKGGRYSNLYLVFPLENLNNLDEEMKQKFSQSLKVELCSQSSPVIPQEGSQSSPVIPKPSLTLFNHHLYVKLSNSEKEAYLEYVAIRKKKKLTTTINIHNRLLEKYFEFGRDIEIINKAITGNWSDFYEIKNNQKLNNDWTW